jgi:DNA-binding response OmpR family regulator
MPRLLLVEADPFMQRTLQKLFAAEEYFCAVAADGEAARRALQGDPFDLIVLHVGERREESLNLLRQIRTTLHVPVLLLGPQSDVVETVTGLEVGADDYLCEPFDPRELVARVRAQLRRADEYSRPASENPTMDLGGAILDVSRRDAFRDGAALKLTTREFDLLSLLARHRGKALASAWIFENVWGHAAELGLKALTVYIGRVRRKIEVDARHPLLLLSVRGFGYKLAAAAEPAVLP